MANCPCCLWIAIFHQRRKGLHGQLFPHKRHLQRLVTASASEGAIAAKQPVANPPLHAKFQPLFVWCQREFLNLQILRESKLAEPKRCAIPACRSRRGGEDLVRRAYVQRRFSIEEFSCPPIGERYSQPVGRKAVVLTDHHKIRRARHEGRRQKFCPGKWCRDSLVVLCVAPFLLFPSAVE